LCAGLPVQEFRFVSFLQHDSCLCRALGRGENKSRTWASPRFASPLVVASPLVASPLVASPLHSRAFNALRAPHPSSRLSMALNSRTSSTCHTLHDADDDVHSALQVLKPSRSCRNELSRSRLTALCACGFSQGPVTLIQMSPLDDDVDVFCLQVQLSPKACESARWRHRVSLSVCCCVSRACSVVQLQGALSMPPSTRRPQGALSMPPSTRRPPPASWTPCVGVALTGVVCARVNCFTELIVVVLYLCSSCLLVFVPAMPPSCLKVHAHALSVGKLMCAVNGSQLPFADRLQVPRKTPSLLPQTRHLSTGGAYDVLASVGLRPAAAPSVGRLKGNEQHASCRTRVDHDLRRELRRAYKAAGVSQEEVEDLAVYVLRYVSAGSVQAVRPAAGRGVASFGYRPPPGKGSCDAPT
jgi:hypothetical protein